MAKILVVDDSGTIRTSLKKTLETAGHQVLEAVDGNDGLSKLASSGGTIDLILSDINMPEMDGLTMCQKIKSDAALKGVPIFIVSTETSPEMKAKGKEIGVTAWMTKPPNPAKLVEAVAKIMEIRAGAAKS